MSGTSKVQHLLPTSSLYSFVIIKRNHLKLCMFRVAGETHIHDSFKVILFDKRKDIKPSSISHYARVT